MPFLAAFLGSVLALAQPGDCADCKSDARRPVLCSPHLELENATLKEQRSAYRQSAESDGRIAALERVAQLTGEHANAATPSVARFLADGLRDPVLEVRRRALALLIDGQHHDEAVRGVVDAWKEALRGWRVLDAKLVLSEAPVEPGKASLTLTNEDLSEIPDYMELLLRALGGLRDERAMTCLHAFLRSSLDRTPGRFLVTACDAMLALDSRRACECVITLLGELEEAFVQGEVPRRFAADGRTDLLAALKAPLENANSNDHAAIIELLQGYAQAKELPAPAPPEPPRAADWKAWFKLVRDSLPDKIASD